MKHAVIPNREITRTLPHGHKYTCDKTTPDTIRLQASLLRRRYGSTIIFRRVGILVFLITIQAVAVAAAADLTGKVIDDQGNGIPQAVVFVQNPPAQASTKTLRKATLDQINKQFSPRLLPIAVGTEVQFPNHDQIHHHVYSFSRIKSFDLPLYKGEAIPSVTFDQPGVVAVGCNIHDWMSATILVVPSSYFATTDTNGQFTITDLPSGSYSLVAWHERSRAKLADSAQQIQVEEKTPELTFTLTLKPAPAARPANSGQRGYQ